MDERQRDEFWKQVHIGDLVMLECRTRDPAGRQNGKYNTRGRIYELTRYKVILNDVTERTPTTEHRPGEPTLCDVVAYTQIEGYAKL
ncbi:hypothetical protein KY363_00605 [Candidatus Woesearchaeota archaeon]|nr:hypothetical protein [Candidatus Woesearchaeota archaeon]